ncbi:MAG: S-methyl-5'-thioadenosine phosphorylase, partial [gamma proteobacterium symbiont of Ctena orbiculata]
MTKLAIIGGTGLDEIPDLEITHREVCHTQFGEPSAAL